jgi:LysR family transcriptional regulator for bpeEF and oprC
MNQLRAMQAFVQVVETGSFTAAARELGVSRAKISTYISEIEQYLGVLLLTRTTRSLSLTHDGREYFSHCKRVLGDIEETESRLRSTQARLHGRLRVDASSGLASNLILPVVRKFISMHPDISIELTSTGHVWDLSGPQCDVMLRTGHLPDSSLVSKTIYQGRTMTVASPEYIAAHGMPATPDDLASHDCIGFINPSNGREIDEWTFWKNGIQCKASISSKLVLNDGEVYLAAALSGFGIAHGQDYSFEPYLRSGRLISLLSQWEGPAPPVNALYQHSKELSLRVRTFVGFLSSELLGS